MFLLSRFVDMIIHIFTCDVLAEVFAKFGGRRVGMCWQKTLQNSAGEGAGKEGQLNTMRAAYRRCMATVIGEIESG